MRDEITAALREVEPTVGITMSDDAPYEFLIDDLEPTVGQVFSVERLSDVPPFEDLEVQRGVIVVYEEITGECWAGGVGTYNQIGRAAFEPIHEFFER